MPIRWLEGFDVMNNAAGVITDEMVNRRYELTVSTPELAGIELVAGRTGGRAWKSPGGGAPFWKIRTPEFPDSVYYTVGMALRMKKGTGTLLSLYNKLDLVIPQIYVTLSNTGTTTTITVKRGGDNTTLGTYVYDFDDQWVYLELEFAVSQGTAIAYCNIYIDGEAVLTIDGVSTAGVITSGANHVEFGGTTSNAVTGEFLLDDVYIASGIRGSGAAALPPELLGDSVVQEALPDLDGEVMDGTAVGAASPYLCVDDPNGETDADATYVEVTGLSKKALFNFPVFVDQGEAVVAVEVEQFVRTTSGTPTEQCVITKRVGSALGASPTTYPAPTGGAYTRLSHILENDMFTGEPWELADVNGTQFGYGQEL